MRIRPVAYIAVSIEACSESRRALMPSLLLQPLVESAVHHGLEGKLGGGVTVRATICDGRVEVRIDDDGLGIGHAPRLVRAGAVLANIRTRLHTRYAGAAALALAPLEQGTRATLSLPCRAAAGSAHPAPPAAEAALTSGCR